MKKKIEDVSIEDLLADEGFPEMPTMPEIPETPKMPSLESLPDYKPASFPKKKGKKSHKIRNRIIGGIIACLAIAGIAFSIFSSGTTYYKNEEQTGNTPGNLLNGGLFSESDGRIYFANPYDNNQLYSMDGNLSDFKKISNDNVSYLNVAGNYIFYTKRNDQKKNKTKSFLTFSSTGLYRINKSGGDLVRYYQDPTQVATLHGNYLYYQQYDQKKGLRLCKVKINKSEEKLLSNDEIAPYSIIGDNIYSAGYRADHSIHIINAQNGTDQILFNGNCFNVMVSGNYIYYMDLENDYRLCRISIDGQDPTVVVNSHISTYNISDDGDTIYYQVDDGKNNGLYEYNMASGKNKMLSSGNFSHLHLTTNYLFFEEFDGSTLYAMHLGNEEIEELRVPKIETKKRGF